MGYEIHYTDQRTGSHRVHRYDGNRQGAEDWCRGKSRDNGGCKSTAIEKGRFSNPDTHLLTVGDDG